MRCMKHYTDLSSTIGVCACCLRERLIAAQQQSLLSNNNNTNTTSFHHHPPPLHHHTFSDQLFYQTPQINPSTTAAAAANSSNKKRRFFSFQNIFRSRNQNPAGLTASDGGNNATSSPSWFSIIYNGRHCRKKTVSVDETTAVAACYGEGRQHCRDRGMSPVRLSKHNEDELCNGYESTESWKNTPRRTPAVRRGGGHVRNLSFCLSPLVRASPNRQRNQKSSQVEGFLSGEIRVPLKPHLSNAKSFCANRSRKLADFGRVNLNR